MKNNNLVAVFCFDKNYAKYCQVALFSLIVNHGSNVKVYCVFTDDVASIDLDNIKSLSTRFDIDLEFIEVPLVSEISIFKTLHHFTQANYLRLLLPDLLPQEQKILYLDCDLIINKSLAALYDTNISNYKYAGVIDKIGSESSKIEPIFKQSYVNSGVLLMNLKALREDNSFEKIKVLYERYSSTITWVDQCLINIYAHREILMLDDMYNCQIYSGSFDKQRWSEVSQNIFIYHFVGGTKPWHKRSRKHIADFWWGFANALNSDQLQIVDSNLINDLMVECKSLEEYENYKDSCGIKDRIIQGLLSHIKNGKNPGKK